MAPTKILRLLLEVRWDRHAIPSSHTNVTGRFGSTVLAVPVLMLLVLVLIRPRRCDGCIITATMSGTLVLGVVHAGVKIVLVSSAIVAVLCCRMLTGIGGGWKGGGLIGIRVGTVGRARPRPIGQIDVVHRGMPFTFLPVSVIGAFTGTAKAGLGLRSTRNPTACEPPVTR
uniref:Uncharacterized protein n=1 Tax=Anopheles culicifacies TaxID=139723 RepID=A0A182MSW2_9DIPT